MNRTLIRAAAAAAGALALGFAAPATAASIGVADPADVDHGVDLRAVRVVNGDQYLKIFLTHADLRRSPRSGAGGVVDIDTDLANKGPELVFVGGYFAGTDYQLLQTEGFGPKKWGDQVSGFHQLSLDYDREKTRMRISRATSATSATYASRSGLPGSARTALTSSTGWASLGRTRGGCTAADSHSKHETAGQRCWPAVSVRDIVGALGSRTAVSRRLRRIPHQASANAPMEVSRHARSTAIGI